MQKTEKSLPIQSGTQPTLTVRGKPVRPWLVMGSLIFGFFMALLDATIVNIAIPTIQSSLKSDLTTVSWVLSAYNLVFAVLLVTVGRFADQYGRKRLFMIGMVIFSIGSLFCAMAETFGQFTGLPAVNWLIGFRALQAIGAAGLNPVSLAIIMSVFPTEKRGAAIGIWGASSGIAAAGGPVLGGFLVENFDWRWIFFVNIPFCIVGLIMVALFVPETSNPRVSKRIDIAGILTLSVSIFCLVLAIIQGNSWGWSSAATIGLFIGAVAGLILFIVAELYQKEPIVDFSLFKAISFTGANLTMFFFGIAIQGTFLILVLYFINGRGYDQLQAAYASLPVPLASMVVAIIAGRLSRKINPNIIAIIGMLLLVIGFGLLCFINADSSYIDVAWRSLFLGTGMGLIFQSLPALSLEDVPPAKFGVGSGIFNTFRQIGFALGVAILISVFTGSIQTDIPQAGTNAIAIVKADKNLPEQMQAGIITGLKQSSNASTASEGGSGNSSSQQVDLTQYVNKLPAQMPATQKAAIKTELALVGNKISHEFQSQTTNAFISAWIVAAGFAVAGLISAIVSLILHRPQAARKAANQAEKQDPVAIIAD
ncbi:MFS transporter [Dictyobacter alpinus]|uniref:MFS transporter n=1 Tax=Dictyobacter alpinus TaxID=2014873 RepID=A0A402BH14_9CHLR|nr:MFS transporter [Dictyobacter alpinus]GCE30663.1 MFS transporter [Dictyobacter alpinus]